MRIVPMFIVEALESWALKKIFLSQPDVMIGDDEVYMERWHIIPRNPFFNIYLHNFLKDDDNRAVHDHPWASASLLISGSYIEFKPGMSSTGLPHLWREYFRRGDLILRSAKAAHRIELINGKHCVTLFMTGPRIREWGFHCKTGWRHWREFEERGCD